MAGPALSSTPPSLSPGVWGPALGSALPVRENGSFPIGGDGTVSGAWGGTGPSSISSKTAEAAPPAILDAAVVKGKNKKKLVLLGMQNRRY
jgi:hypothetical protein